jgi:hypothetical protein
METYLMITDVTGKQYPYLIPEEGIPVEDFTVTIQNHNLDEVQGILEMNETIRVKNRIFRAEHIVEISILEIPAGAV